jgi:hypothetical protein
VAFLAGRDPDIHAGDILLPRNLLTESLVNHEGHKVLKEEPEDHAAV